MGPNPTDRGKQGTKKSLLTEAGGGPLAVVVGPANRNDHLLLTATLDALIVQRPEPTTAEPQRLCLDKAYDNPASEATIKAHGYEGHVRRIGEEKLDQSGERSHPARRWVVERTFAWLSKCRGILVRYEKKAGNYLGMLKLAIALLWYRRRWALTN